MKEESELKKKDIKTKVILCVFIILVVISLVYSFFWMNDNKKSISIAQELVEITEIEEVEEHENIELVESIKEDDLSDYWYYTKIPLISVNFSELLKKNTDTVGWIQVAGTNINYPIVQSNDNEYYLTRAFDSSKNEAGWIFADYKNNIVSFDRNTVIYGHSRLNNTMFGTLHIVTNKAWYSNKDNHIVKLSTPTENTLWQVFSVYKVPSETYYITTSFNNNNQYTEFLETIKQRSIHEFEVSLTQESKVLTLSTCTNSINNGRMVLHAKLIKREVR